MHSSNLIVCHLTSAHPSTDPRIFLKQCQSLAAAGYDVVLIACSGESAVVDGVRIISVGERPSGRFSRVRQTVEKVLEAALLIPAAVYHLHDPELLRITSRLKATGAAVIYDAHEDLPRQILQKNWIPSLMRKPASKMLEWYESSRIRQLDGVIAATPGIRDRLVQYQPNTTDVCNYPLRSEMLSIDRAGVDATPTACYVGLITRERGLLDVVRALPLAGCHLLLAGRILEASFYDELTAEPGWEYVEYLGIIDRLHVRKVYEKSIAGIVTFRDHPNHVRSLPTKLFEYMGAGLPVIASDFPLWKSIVLDNECGLCVKPGSAIQIAAALKELLIDRDRARNMGTRGRSVVLDRYTWATEEAKLLEFYSHIAFEDSSNTA